jgi:hypothetical protein
MATTAKTLYHGQPTNAAATLYTVPGSTVAIIRHIRVVNDDSASHNFDLWRNGSASANRITENITLQPGTSWEDDVYMPLAAADTIQGKADTSAKLTVYIGGVEIV